MSVTHYYGIQLGTGEVTPISTVENRLKQFICPGCSAPLVPVINVTKKQPHFRHKADTGGFESCAAPRHATESVVHWLLKHAIADRLEIKLPPVIARKPPMIFTPASRTPLLTRKYGWFEWRCNLGPVQITCEKVIKFSHVLLEHYIPHLGIRPDVIGYCDGREIIIELCVSHAVDEHKKGRIAASGLSCVEITATEALIRQIEYSDITSHKTLINDFLNSGEGGAWIHNAWLNSEPVQSNIRKIWLQSEEQFMRCRVGDMAVELLESIPADDVATSEFYASEFDKSEGLAMKRAEMDAIASDISSLSKAYAEEQSVITTLANTGRELITYLFRLQEHMLGSEPGKWDRKIVMLGKELPGELRMRPGKDAYQLLINCMTITADSVLAGASSRLMSDPQIQKLLNKFNWSLASIDKSVTALDQISRARERQISTLRGIFHNLHKSLAPDSRLQGPSPSDKGGMVEKWSAFRRAYINAKTKAHLAAITDEQIISARQRINGKNLSELFQIEREIHRSRNALVNNAQSSKAQT